MNIIEKLNCNVRENSTAGTGCFDDNFRLADFNVVWRRGVCNNFGDVIVGEIKSEEDSFWARVHLIKL